jgi:hypothetical protein
MHAGLWLDRERNRQLGKARRRWEDNVRIDLREIWREGVDWMHLAQDRDQWPAPVNTVTNFWFHKRRGSS